MKRVLNLGEEYFNSSWAMTDANDALTSMKVWGHDRCERRSDQHEILGVGIIHTIIHIWTNIHTCSHNWALIALLKSRLCFHGQAHGKRMPEGLTDRLVAVINRLAAREFAAFVVSKSMNAYKLHAAQVPIYAPRTLSPPPSIIASVISASHSQLSKAPSITDDPSILMYTQHYKIYSVMRSFDLFSGPLHQGRAWPHRDPAEHGGPAPHPCRKHEVCRRTGASREGDFRRDKDVLLLWA